MSRQEGFIDFIDHSDEIKAILEDALIKSLYESGDIIKTQTQKNSRVDTGQTKESWDCVVDEAEMTATIGNPLENAYWEEFGTGEYALNGKGRKKGWHYKDKDGKWHFTYGKTPKRMLFIAYTMKKGAVVKCFRKNIKDKFSR